VRCGVLAVMHWRWASADRSRSQRLELGAALRELVGFSWDKPIYIFSPTFNKISLV